MTVGWRGSKLQDQAEFPLLLKFIFPKDKLSIQVHPDDSYAAAHEQAAGGRGKTEMWHVVSAEPGARLLAGLKTGVTRERFRAALADHTLEELFESYEVSAGDTFFLPAGVPHSIGPGMIVCEVQEYSDLTYRVYDYGRVDASGKPRQLHVQRALEVINFQWDGNTKASTRSTVAREKSSWQPLVDCAYFSATKLQIDEEIELNVGPRAGEQFKLSVFLEGRGGIESFGEPSGLGKRGVSEFSYNQGECWFFPAGFSNFRFCPQEKTSALMASPLKHDLKPVDIR